MHFDQLDNTSQSRAHDLRVLCNYVLNIPPVSHFTVRTQTRFYNNEIETIRKRYPQLAIEVLEEVSDDVALSCVIYKKEN